MKYSYETTEEQWIEFQLFQVRRTYSKIRFRAVKTAALIAIDLILATDIFFMIFLQLQDTTNNILLLSAVFVLVNWYQIQQLFYSPRLVEQKCRALLQKNPSLFVHQTTTCEIADGKLTLTEECGIVSIIPVHLLYEIAETPRSILIYKTSTNAELVPKTIFSTPEEKRYFLEALKS